MDVLERTLLPNPWHVEHSWYTTWSQAFHYCLHTPRTSKQPLDAGTQDLDKSRSLEAHPNMEESLQEEVEVEGRHAGPGSLSQDTLQFLLLLLVSHMAAGCRNCTEYRHSAQEMRHSHKSLQASNHSNPCFEAVGDVG